MHTAVPCHIHDWWKCEPSSIPLLPSAFWGLEPVGTMLSPLPAPAFLHLEWRGLQLWAPAPTEDCGSLRMWWASLSSSYSFMVIYSLEEERNCFSSSFRIGTITVHQSRTLVPSHFALWQIGRSHIYGSQFLFKAKRAGWMIRLIAADSLRLRTVLFLYCLGLDRHWVNMYPHPVLVQPCLPRMNTL